MEQEKLKVLRVITLIIILTITEISTRILLFSTRKYGNGSSLDMVDNKLRENTSDHHLMEAGCK